MNIMNSFTFAIILLNVILLAEKLDKNSAFCRVLE